MRKGILTTGTVDLNVAALPVCVYFTEIIEKVTPRKGRQMFLRQPAL
jgi:hypothetical protein